MTPPTAADDGPTPDPRQSRRLLAYLPVDLHNWVVDVAFTGTRWLPGQKGRLGQAAVVREALLRLRNEYPDPAKAAAVVREGEDERAERAAPIEAAE